jgi:hypothetical protein
MKNKMRYIIIGLLLWATNFAFGQSISEPSRNNQYNNLEQEFQSARIDAARLPAFEKRAQQKLKDMFNYIEIISNKAYEEDLRKEAMSICLDLFAKGSSIKSEILSGNKVKSYDCPSFFNGVLKTEFAAIQITLSNIKSLDALVYNESKSAYMGRLSVHVAVVRKGGQSLQSDYIVDYQVAKQAKKFGSNTEQVWTLLLSDCYLRP